MKSFLKTLLASFLGCCIALMAAMFICFGFIGAIAALGQQQAPVIPKSGILKLDFENTITEKTVPISAMQILQGSNTGTTPLLKALQAIEKAAEDPAVKFIYMTPDNFKGSISTAEEIRNALERFRTSGKAVISYTQTPTLGSYFLASVSDKIYMPDYGTGMMFGLGSNMIYFKDLLDKLGINVQLIRHGKYKSAGEPYIKSEMSPENRKQNEDMLNAIWKTMGGKMAASRELTIEDLDRMFNNLELESASDFKRLGLVDDLYDKDEMADHLCKLYDVEDESKLSMIPFDDYAASLIPNFKSKNKIAVVYADGQIVEGKSSTDIGGDSFSEELRKLRRDTTIRTIVLRVNSPGGSVTAAEKVKREIDLIQKQGRTVIASYGSYAASGGYWISANCDYIFSDATTLTGSIGVFSMIPDLGEAAKKLAHLNIHTVKTHEHADMMSLMRPFDSKELEYMQKSVDNIYSQFTGIVAEGRNMSVEDVDEIAQGRVWCGTEALGIGLVDEIGGLNEAILYAAAISGYSDFNIVEYPKPMTQLEMIMEQLGTTMGFISSPVESIYDDIREDSGKAYARMLYDYEFNL